MADTKNPKASPGIISQVAERIDSCDNVLVALSKDPSVDELSAALGLTFILDRLGKHATAIFSGAVPNAIEFLEPEKTFETNTNSLQDFIIALDKEKADHLRYKIDGDYVKVFITPYKTTINQSDFEFSHGDYNVDLVVALNVESVADLDGALTEYGRIMHDASSINIHAGEPGRFGDLEWGNPKASSVSEMICNLSEHLTTPKDKAVLDKPAATALLAGIVAATNRFSNEHTSAETMAIASRLMAAGADQQLISSSIPVDILTNDVVDATPEAAPVSDDEPQVSATSDAKPEAEAKSVSAAENQSTPESVPKPEPEPVDPTALTIRHGAIDFDPSEPELESIPEPTPEPEPAATPALRSTEKPESTPRTTAIDMNEPAKDSAPEKNESTPQPSTSMKTASESRTSSQDEAESKLASAEKADAMSQLDAIVSAPSATDSLMDELEETAINEGKKNLTPPSEVGKATSKSKDYAAMMSAELAAPTPPTMSAPANTPENEPQSEPEPVDFSTFASVPSNSQVFEEPTIANSAPLQTPDAKSFDSNISAMPDVSSSPASPNISQPIDSAVPNNPSPAEVRIPDPMMQTAELVENPMPLPDSGIELPPPPQPFDPSLGQMMPPSSFPEPPAMSNLAMPENQFVPEPTMAAPVMPAPVIPADLAATNSTNTIEQPAPDAVAPVDQFAASQVAFDPVAGANFNAPMTDANFADPLAQGSIAPAGNAAIAAAEANANYLGSNPAMPDQLYPDPSAFQIPGM